MSVVNFKAFRPAVDHVLNGGRAKVMYMDREIDLRDALISIGYDGAEVRGVLQEYKTLILGVSQ
jgi:hypothetical protein